MSFKIPLVKFSFLMLHYEKQLTQQEWQKSQISDFQELFEDKEETMW